MELFFTFYISHYGLSNLLGHYTKIISYLLVYQAIIVTGIRHPYNLIFRDLKHNENMLKKSLTLTEEEKKRADLMALRAERASQAKTQFLASMSHELRTPLNSVIGFSEVLQDQYFGPLNDKQADYVKDIWESGQHLLMLINDVLDLAKVEAGKMELELAPVRIADLLKHCLVMVKEKAMRHGIQLDCRIPSELADLGMDADERKLKQVIYNLLANAAKFTPDGGAIILDLQKADDLLRISVADTGRGLAAEDLEKVFEEFHQVMDKEQGKTPGTGLGLSLSRRMVEMWGGKLWAESEGIGRGSRFVFTLPLISKGEETVPVTP